MNKWEGTAMEVPLEINFHNLDKTEWAEADIRSRVVKLNKIYDRLTACRVSVEAPHRQHRTGNLFEVRIEMTVPGKTLMVDKEPHHAKEKYATADLRVAIRDAFKAAERQLKSFKQQISGEVKPHEAQFHGHVTQIVPEQDHGFLLNKEGSQLYFHRNSVLRGDFDSIKPGDVVHYVEEIGDTGPIATKVRVGPEHEMD